MSLSKCDDWCEKNEKNKWSEENFSEHVVSPRWETPADFTLLDAREGCNVTPLRGVRRDGRKPLETLCPWSGLCYNRKAVKDAGKQADTSTRVEGGSVLRSADLLSAAGEPGPAPQEDASRYCPVCSQRLESRRCKLICNVCGYYMSCADYY